MKKAPERTRLFCFSLQDKLGALEVHLIGRAGCLLHCESESELLVSDGLPEGRRFLCQTGITQTSTATDATETTQFLETDSMYVRKQLVILFMGR